MSRLVLLGFFLWALVPSLSHAAYLYFDPAEVELSRGDTALVTLRIDTDDGECINTVDATIQYEGGVLPIDISRGDSIFNIWVEEPTINEAERTITLAGGITGGYCGRAAGDPGLSNTIVTFVLQSPGFAIGGEGGGVPKISLADTTRVLLNDGLGTDAEVRTSGVAITLNDTPGAEHSDEWSASVSSDVTPPADFVITLSQEETAFSGNYFVSWNSADKQTGIDHYEIMEESLEDLYSFTWGRADAPWVRAQSPYVLKDQTLNSTIRVKAIDKAGNETIAVLIPDEAIRSLSRGRALTYVVVVAVAVLSLGLIGYALFERKRRLLMQYESNAE